MPTAAIRTIFAVICIELAFVHQELLLFFTNVTREAFDSTVRVAQSEVEEQLEIYPKHPNLLYDRRVIRSRLHEHGESGINRRLAEFQEGARGRFDIEGDVHRPRTEQQFVRYYKRLRVVRCGTLKNVERLSFVEKF